ncbi:MAG: CapA family protein [Lachnospiraceae bacterium]|nr:CapA family protein [Lachnospiraceae bacterium]
MKKAIIIFCIVFSLVFTLGCLGLYLYAESDLRKGNREVESLQEEEDPGKVSAEDSDELAVIEDSAAREETERLEEEEAETDADATEEEPSDLETIETDAAKEPVTMVFTGDICFHDPFANMASYRQRGSDIEKCIDSYLLTEMREADFCVVNNEFPYSNRGTPAAGKTYTFRSKPENVKIMNEIGVDVASVANNHAFDHGEDAFLDTLDILKEAGIASVGGGRNIEEAAAPVILEKGGMKIGIIAATQIERTGSPETRGATDTLPGVMRSFSEAEQARFLEAAKSARQQCDFLIAFVHWGSENTDVLDSWQTGQAAALAECGVDLIVGAHPHCLQGLGQCGGVPVIYSLGNYWFNSKRVDTALLKVVIEDGSLTGVQMIPALQHDCRTDHLEGAEKQRIIDYLNSISRDGISLDAEGYLVGV